MHGPRPRLPLALLLVLLIATPLFFARLRAPLLEPQEGRYAEVPRQMLAQGHWLVPVLHGEPYLDKPPLLYWAVMASYRIFGVHDWAARLVPALAGVLTAVVACLWGRGVLGGHAGLCGPIMLCLMPEFVYRGRMLTFDTLLALWVTASLASAHLAVAGPAVRRGWWLLSALACGAGLLTKGPVALVLVAVPLFAAGVLDRRLARPGWRGWAVYLGVAVAVAAPWYVAVCGQLPDFAVYFFWKHNVVRFVAPFDHARPAWFYLPGLVVGLMPWTLLVPVLAVRLAASLPSPSCGRGVGAFFLPSPPLRGRGAGGEGEQRETASKDTKRQARNPLTPDHSLAEAGGEGSNPQRPAALTLLVVSALWMVAFFSAAGCKRPTYLLPAFPPLALALGWLLTRLTPAPDGLWRQRSALASASAGLALFAGIGVCIGAVVTEMVAPAVGYTLAAAGLVGLVLVVRFRLSWAAAAVVVFVVLLAGVREVLPGYNDQFSIRGQLRRQAKADDVGGRAVVCYPQRFECVSFYLPHSEVLTFGPAQREELIAHLCRHPDTLLLVKSGRVLDDLVAQLPRSVEFVRGPKGVAVTVGRVVPRR